jgi:hypothetical protein
MPHAFRTAACLTSLTLCLATAGMWARSQGYRDTIGEGWVDGPQRIVHSRHVTSVAGCVYYQRIDDQVSVGSFRDEHYPPDKYFRGWRWTSMPGGGLFDTGSLHQRLGFDWQTHRNYPLGAAVRLRGDFVRIPYWLPAGLFAIAPTVWVARRLRRARRVRRGLCPPCGYDLRASTGGVCPEFGRAAPLPALPARAAGAAPA